MAKVEDCPGFETFGADVKEARKAKNLARKDLAEKVNIDTRYLANIENEGTNRTAASSRSCLIECMVQAVRERFL